MTSLVAPLLVLALPAPFVGSTTARFVGFALESLHTLPAAVVLLVLAAGIAFAVRCWRR